MARPLARTAIAAICAASTGAAFAQTPDAPASDPLGQRLEGVLLADAAEDLQARHDDAPEDQSITLALGTTHLLLALERIGQFMYRHGFDPGWHMGAFTANFFGPPAPVNMQPEPLTMDDLDALCDDWADDLRRAQEILAEVDDPDARLRLRIGLVRFDFDANGEAEEREELWRAFSRINPRRTPSREDAEGFDIAFDRADAAWMRGYGHLAIAATHLARGYDYQRWLEHVGHAVFRGYQSPYPFLRHVRPQDARLEGVGWLGDVAAAIHLFDFPVRDADRIGQALEEIRTALEMSGQMVEWARAEEDDDREWIPAPDQRGVFPEMRVQEEHFDAWTRVLDELDAILAGDKLAPFWRGADAETRGVNVRRVFEEPRRFDLVLWIQGTAAEPYLEDGELTEPELWGAVAAAFGWQFPRYAAWFN